LLELCHKPLNNLMATFDLNSFDELEATPHEEAKDAADKHVVSAAAALAEAEEAMAKSVELCKRFDPEEEPFRSKYLAREALKIAIKKLAQHTSGGAEARKACQTMSARLEWRVGAICMDVEETGNAKDYLIRCLSYWRPKVVELIEAIPLDTEGKSASDQEDAEDEEVVVRELLAYCEERARAEGLANSWPVEVVECLSHLGIYHHNFEHFKHGLLCLKLSEALIQQAAKSSRQSESELGSSSKRSSSCHTHVVFYLAQAYAALHRPHEAASYCQLTLQLQLQDADPDVLVGNFKKNGGGGEACDSEFGGESAKVAFNSSEWYKNCAGLVEYFIAQDRYVDAEHCLRACDVIVEHHMKVPPPPATPAAIADAEEKRQEAMADMDRRWGLLYLNILQDAAHWRLLALREHYLAGGGGGGEDSEEGQAAARARARTTTNSNGKASLQNGVFPTLTNSVPSDSAAAAAAPASSSSSDKIALSLPDDREDAPMGELDFSEYLVGMQPCTATLPTQVKTFEAARSVFKAAMSRHAKAKAFFVLDGFVTDHVALCRDVSSMYKSLCCFEDDEKRKTIMYGRRTAELLPILDQLGKNAYNDTLKQLAFECGEIFMEMTEMKQERVAAKRSAGGPAYRPKQAEVAKCNEYCCASIKAFEDFTNLYRREKPVPLFPVPAERGAESDEEGEYDDEETKERKAKRRSAKAFDREEERKGGALTVPDDELGIHLRAHFYIARMHGKLLPLPSEHGEARVKGLRQSLEKYVWLGKFAREQIAKLPKVPKPKTILSDPDKPEPWTDPAQCFKDELAMCDQMVELLPQQIARVHFLKEEFK